jgi:hypothetical protein
VKLSWHSTTVTTVIAAASSSRTTKSRLRRAQKCRRKDIVPRDDGWEEHGVFRSVLRPRIEAAAMRYGASWQFARIPAPSSDSGGEPHTAIA